jgi:hypothetical protein
MQPTERYLPAAAALRPVARSETLGSLFWLVMLLLWWQGFNAVAWRWFGWAPMPFGAAPVWDRIAPLVIAFVAGGLVRDAVVLARPRAVRFHAAAGLLLDVVALKGLLTLLGSGDLITIVNPAHPAAVFESWIDGGVWILLLVFTVAFVASAAFGTRRLSALELRSPFFTRM